MARAVSWKDFVLTSQLPELLEAINRLTLPIADTIWQPTLDDRGREAGRTLVTIDRLPLLHQLRNAISSSLGQTHAGHSDPASRLGGLNVAAFTLYEDIDGRIRSAWLDMTGEYSKADPDLILRRWYLRVRNLFEAGAWSAGQVNAWSAVVRRWVKDIDNMFDPEVVKELSGPCPNCEAARFHDKKEDVQKSALYLHYKEDIEPEAVCRSCGWTETGPRRLLELGYHLGAVVDEDTLKEMGVIA